MSSTSARVEGGFTLVELMVVVAIVAILGAIAAPALRGRHADQFKRDFGKLYQELLQAKALSLSKKEQYSLIVNSQGHYSVRAAWPTSGAHFPDPPLRDVRLSDAAKITNVKLCADLGAGCTGDFGIPANVRFVGAEIIACLSGCDDITKWKPSSVTFYLQGFRLDGSVDPTLQKRIVVFQSTGYVKQYR